MGYPGLKVLVAISGGIASDDPMAIAVGICAAVVLGIKYAILGSKENEKRTRDKEVLDCSHSALNASK